MDLEDKQELEPDVLAEDYQEADDNPIDDDMFKEDLSYGNTDDYGSSITPMEKHSDLLKELTSFDQYLKETVNGWLGLVWNSEEKSFTSSELIEPMMNKKGAAWCISLLKTYTRSNNIITNINKEEYNHIIAEVIDTIWLNIGTRAESFGIKSNGDILRICNELQHATELVLMGAGGGKYNDLLKDTTDRKESLNIPLQPGMGYPGQMQKPGMFNKVKNWLV